MTPEFKLYSALFVSSSRALGKVVDEMGYKVVTGGTNNSLVLSFFALTTSQIENACDVDHITINNNAVAGDIPALTPGDVHVGTSAVTSKVLKEVDVMNLAKVPRLWR